MEKKISNTFNISSSHSGVVVSSQSYTMPGKKPDLKSIVTKQAKNEEIIRGRKKSYENQTTSTKTIDSLKERQKKMVNNIQ